MAITDGVAILNNNLLTGSVPNISWDTCERLVKNFIRLLSPFFLLVSPRRRAITLGP